MAIFKMTPDVVEAVAKQFGLDAQTITGVETNVNSDMQKFVEENEDRVSRLNNENNDINDTKQFLERMGNEIQERSQKNSSDYKNQQGRTEQNDMNLNKIVNDYLSQSTARISYLNNQINTFDLTVKGMKARADGLKDTWEGNAANQFSSTFESITNKNRQIQGSFEKLNKEINQSAQHMQGELEKIDQDVKKVIEFINQMEAIEREFARNYMENHEGIDKSLANVSSFIQEVLDAETKLKTEVVSVETDLIKNINYAQGKANEVQGGLNESANNLRQQEAVTSAMWSKRG